MVVSSSVDASSGVGALAPSTLVDPLPLCPLEPLIGGALALPVLGRDALASPENALAPSALVDPLPLCPLGPLIIDSEIALWGPLSPTLLEPADSANPLGSARCKIPLGTVAVLEL